MNSKLKALLCAALLAACPSAWAWGDVGHKVVGQIADHYLDPAVRGKVQSLLASDSSHLTTTDIANEATWADKYRDTDRMTTKQHYNQTHEWHYVDIDIHSGDVDAACFGHPTVPPDKPASQGPAKDCVIDKIDEFSAELASASTSPAEKLLALQFLLHLVGDLHQPLHASDDGDHGGNLKMVSAAGIREDSLHHYWDDEFLRKLGGGNYKKTAQQLIDKITPGELKSWRQGASKDWALQSYRVAKSKVYAGLGKPVAKNKYVLSPTYVTQATQATGTQLSRAGVRLAHVLNQALK